MLYKFSEYDSILLLWVTVSCFVYGYMQLHMSTKEKSFEDIAHEPVLIFKFAISCPCSSITDNFMSTWGFPTQMSQCSCSQGWTKGQDDRDMNI